MAKLTLQDAEATAQKGRPWTFRLVDYGLAKTAKFFYATGRKHTECVETGVYKAGNEKTPATAIIGWDPLRVEVAEKLAAGWVYDSTDYIRMTPEGIAKAADYCATCGENMSSCTCPPDDVTVPAPVAAPVVAPPAPPVVPVALPPPSGAKKYLQAPCASLLAVAAPLNQTRALRLRRTGTKITGYDALDENGNKVAEMSADVGLAFAQTHDSVEIVYG